MALKKRNGYWWIDITYGNQRIRKSTKTKIKHEALALHDQIMSELWKTKNQLEPVLPKKSWVEAVVRWLVAA